MKYYSIYNDNFNMPEIPVYKLVDITIPGEPETTSLNELFNVADTSTIIDVYRRYITTDDFNDNEITHIHNQDGYGIITDNWNIPIKNLPILPQNSTPFLYIISYNNRPDSLVQKHKQKINILLQ